jgi:hypothetical protein
VTDAMQAMKELCQQVTNQKTLIMQSLENDCDKGELNSQIAVSSKMSDINWREIYRYWMHFFNVFFLNSGGTKRAVMFLNGILL